MCASVDLLEPGLLHQVISVLGEEGTGIREEGGGQEAVPGEEPHVHLQTLETEHNNKISDSHANIHTHGELRVCTHIHTQHIPSKHLYIHMYMHTQVLCVGTSAVSIHLSLSPARPDTSLAALSNFSSVSSA